MFALSLLLHYSCVKSPCDAIQKSSNSLRPVAQSSVASFFTVLLAQPKIDRDALRLAIDEANRTPVESEPLNSSQLRAKLSISTNSSPGNTLDETSPQRRVLNTPVSGDRSGPWATINNNNCSTPRTKMLDVWNSENRHLRAQIETERDERQFLEGQLKQSEERIKALSKFLLLLLNIQILLRVNVLIFICCIF